MKALAVVALILVCASCSRSGVTIRRVKSKHSGNAATITFAMTNHTAEVYYISRQNLSVEVETNGAWSQCFSDPFPTPDQHDFRLYANRFKIFTVQATNLPAGAPLRLNVPAGKELHGMDGLCRRWELRIHKKIKYVSLNPFSKTDVVLSDSFPIFSEEFSEP